MSLAKKDEDMAEGSMFYHLDKTTVLQEARIFNVSPIRARDCRLVLTKIAYLTYQSETFGTKEATECFFSVTKLFQSQDAALRQMVYLIIKEFSQVAEDVIMATSSVTKDITANSDLIYRANAIRALVKITDPSILQGNERLMKQALVDKNYAVVKAALVSCIHLFASAKDMVKRWASEIQAALSKPGIASYHALGLMYLIRQNDKMAIIKMATAASRVVFRNPHTYIVLIRTTCRIMDDETPDQRSLMPLLQNFLKHKDYIVVFEAARAITGLRNVTAEELRYATHALVTMLSNHRPTLVFAAIRLLNRIAHLHRSLVVQFTPELEARINDPNRNIATFAITTVLKTGNEASVDTLMKQIASFMGDISDEFKVVIIDAIRSLCLKFPAKQSMMLNFLANVLRDEGGYEYKRATIEAIFDIFYSVPSSRETALSHLCEFIEDCEFTRLAVRVLYLLGTEGPKCATPSKYIRYIYNRLILENAPVRSAAVTALGRFAADVAELRPRIRILLERCLDDNDDEVRDRATLSLRLLDIAAAADGEAASAGDDGSGAAARRAGTMVIDTAGLGKDPAHHRSPAASLLLNENTYVWPVLEAQLYTHLQDAGTAAVPFSDAHVPRLTKTEQHDHAMHARAQREGRLALSPTAHKFDAHGRPSPSDHRTAVSMDASAAGTAGGLGSGHGGAGSMLGGSVGGGASGGTGGLHDYQQELSLVPALAPLGKILHSSAPAALTESETEYVVHCVKHVMPAHVVFQYTCRNTLNDSVLMNVSVQMRMQLLNDMELEAEADPGAVAALAGFAPAFVVPIPQLRYDTPETMWVVYHRPNHCVPLASFQCALHFHVYDVDPNEDLDAQLADAAEETGDRGYEDEYELEGLEIVLADFMVPDGRVMGTAPSFEAAWHAAAAEDARETYNLTAVATCASAVKSIVPMLGLAPVQGSDVVAAGKNTHTLLLAGRFVDGTPCLAQVRMVSEEGAGVTIQVMAKSPNPTVALRVVNAIQ